MEPHEEQWLTKIKDVSEKLQRRKYYRVRYPVAERPRLLINGYAYTIFDISEGGVRFYCNRPTRFDRGEHMEATLVFRDGDSVAISGEIARLEGPCVVLKTSIGVPYMRIIAEQRHLIGKYDLRWEEFGKPTEDE